MTQRKIADFPSNLTPPPSSSLPSDAAAAAVVGAAAAAAAASFVWSKAAQLRRNV